MTTTSVIVKHLACSAVKFKSATKLLIAGLMLNIAGCDGSFTGGGIGGTGAPVAPALVVGVVDGFGSIVINDERYVTDNAKLYTDGSPVGLSELRIGMSISAKVDTDSMQATELRYQPDFVGPVTSIDMNNRTLVIHGQTARWNESTVFDALDLTELTTGLDLEVSGARDANQEIVATYLRKAAVGQPHYAVGRIERGGVEQSTGETVVRMTGSVIDFRRAAEALGISSSEYKSRYLIFGSIVRVAVAGGVDATAETTTADDDDVVSLVITGAHTVAKPTYETGNRVEVLGIVSVTRGSNKFLIGDLEVLVDPDGVTETRSAMGMKIEFPAFPENRPVLVNGTAQAANGEILINTIQFLDQH